MKTLRLFFVVYLLLMMCFCNFNKRLKTPAEENKFKKLSSYDEIINFLKAAKTINPEIEIEIIGKTVEGRDIPMVKYFNNKAHEKPVTIMLIAQQHGNEPSGKEGLLLLIKDMAEKKLAHDFENVNLLIVPQLNIDGAEKNKRRNAADIDLNRDHLILKSPENIAITKIFNKYLPEVTVDFHEYYSYDDTTSTFKFVKNFDEQMGVNTNININSDIIKIQRNYVLPYVKKYLEDKGFSFFEYSPGSVAQNERIRHSTVDISDGRQSFGIINTFSFIFEGHNGTDSINKLEKRTYGQYNAAKSIIEFVAKKSDMIKKTIANSRDSLINNSNDSIILQMEHFKNNETLNITLHNYSENKDSVFLVSNYTPEIKSLLKIKKPAGYLIPKSDTLLLNFVKNQNIIYNDFNKIDKNKIYVYKILQIKKDTLEELAVFNPKVLKEEVKKINFKDYIYVPINQLKSNLISLAIEPQSMLGLANYKNFNYLIEKNNYYPVLRIEKK